MISGNCNRSPQYNAMGPPSTQMYAANNQRTFAQQQQPQHLLFMTGGSVRTFPQMTRGFSMMPNGGTYPAVVHCSTQQGFGNTNYGYPANAAPIFQQHYTYQQPRVMQNQHQFIPHQYISSPIPAETRREQSSGFINGIKNMVKGIIQPLNCDFYSDHHKYYNPKYRNNYMMDLKAENMLYTPHKPEPHVRAVVVDGEMHKAPVKTCDIKPPPKAPQCNEQVKDSAPKTIFSSEDFPELPAPRSSRSVTPAKTESTQKPIEVTQKNKESTAKESTVQPTPKPKSTFFEIVCTVTPSGRRPTFGGRLKVVPPPFSLNKPTRSCRNVRHQESTNDNKDCDIEEDSFVIFQHDASVGGNCLFSSSKRPQRQRKISECSDDSFVVFFTEDADCIGEIHCDEDYDTEDDEDDDDDFVSDEETSSEEDEDDEEGEECSTDEDDNGVDVVDSSFLGRNKTDRNKCDDETTPFCSRVALAGVTAPEHKQLDSGFDEKKVTFDPHPVVHVMHAWNFAYRDARKGHWEAIGRDRIRFQERIQRTSVYLNPVLTPEHREKIYQSRFSHDATYQQKLLQNHQQQGTADTKLNPGSHHQPNVSCGENNLKLPKLTKLPDCASF